MLSKLIVIIGPTASGKSALAIKISQKFSGEIVSADSRQIYRGMNIGTAKPTKEEMTTVPHHLINIKNPDENYTASEYKRDALKAIKTVIKKGFLPILVGGTGFYVKVIIDNLKIPNIKPDFKLRHKLEKEIEKYGLDFVFKKLIKIDPEAAYIVDQNNPRRVIRALEIALKTKKPFSAQRKAGKSLFDFLEIGISMPIKEQNNRIKKRVNLMIKNGLIEEVKNLVKKYGANHQSLDAIGYREIIEYLNKKISLKTATDLIKNKTRRYAKRQMTWFRKDKRINWIKNEKEIEKLIKKFLSA